MTVQSRSEVSGITCAMLAKSTVFLIFSDLALHASIYAQHKKIALPVQNVGPQNINVGPQSTNFHSKISNYYGLRSKFGHRYLTAIYIPLVQHSAVQENQISQTLINTEHLSTPNRIIDRNGSGLFIEIVVLIETFAAGFEQRICLLGIIKTRHCKTYFL